MICTRHTAQTPSLTSSIHARQSPGRTAGRWATSGALETTWILGCGTWSCAGRGWTAGAAPPSWACPWNPDQRVGPAPTGPQYDHGGPATWWGGAAEGFQYISYESHVKLTYRNHRRLSGTSYFVFTELFGKLINQHTQPITLEQQWPKGWRRRPVTKTSPVQSLNRQHESRWGKWQSASLSVLTTTEVPMTKDVKPSLL